MSKLQSLKASVKQRRICAVRREVFADFQEPISGYDAEIDRKRKHLNLVLNPDVQPQRAGCPTDVQKVTKEEIQRERGADGEDCGGSESDRNSHPYRHLLPDTDDSDIWKESWQQKESKSLSQHVVYHTDVHREANQEVPEPPHIKEEQEELWTSQEGEKLQGLEEADITKFTFTPVPVKSEDDEEKPQSSQLHQRQTEQMETEADGEDCGGSEPARNSHPDRHLQPDTDDKTSDSSETETEDSDDWKETSEPQSVFNFLKNNGCNTGEKPFRCSECGKRFNQNSNLKTHMRIHTGEKPFRCSICGKRFIQKVHLTHHMAHHTGEKLLSCSVCDQKFTWRYQLKNHKCVGESSRLHQSQTEENREAEPPASSSTEQMKTVADGEDCGGSDPARNSHPDRHLEPDDKTSDSSETEDSDDWKETSEPQSGLKSHMSCNTSKKSYSCSECGKKFSQKGNLIIHWRIHTGEKPFSCSICCKRFVCKGSLRRHMRIHTGEKPFSCSFCGKSFTQKTGLDYHLKTHTGEKPFSCSVCSKRFIEKGKLLYHMNTHTGEKPFNCSVCGQSFTQKTGLDYHLKTHTGEKPFSCSVCDKRFIQKVHLTEHMAIHTGEKRLSCSICDKRFIWLSQLKRHKCVGESSQLHQRQTEVNREAEPPASSSTEQIETEADGDDCGGSEAARNSHPDRHLQPDTDDKTSDSSETETEDSSELETDDRYNWKDTNEPQSGLSSLEKVPVSDMKCNTGGKSKATCPKCGKVCNKNYLKAHMRTHTGEKPYGCSVCGKNFGRRESLNRHIRCHTGEKPYSCTVCKRHYRWRHAFVEHMRVHNGE